MNNGDYPLPNVECIGRWDIGSKKFVVDNDPVDVGRGRIAAEDWDPIPVGFCRRCKQPIKPYKAEYHEIYSDCVVAYSEKKGYCEACALDHANRKHPSRPEKHPVKITRDVYGRETVTYDDGSEIKEIPWANIEE